MKLEILISYQMLSLHQKLPNVCEKYYSHFIKNRKLFF